MINENVNACIAFEGVAMQSVSIVLQSSLVFVTVSYQSKSFFFVWKEICVMLCFTFCIQLSSAKKKNRNLNKLNDSCLRSNHGLFFQRLCN